MNTANQRSAVGAVDTARPLIARLDIARDPEDIAADIIDGWAATETALRALLGGSALAGQALVRELRQRELLSLDQAHALLEFLAARDRVQRTEYRPTSPDVAAAREGFQKLEERLSQEAEREFARHTAPTAAPAVAPPPSDYVPVPAQKSGRGPGLALLATLLVAIGLAAGAFYFFTRDTSGGALQRGVAAYTAGQREAAKGEFTKAARDNPRLALPHVYLARIAREEGDAGAASNELQTAIRLEPNNAVAQREMGSHQLASGNPELARRFYVRAIQLDPNDRTAQGYLGCALVRLGRSAEAQRFLSRAGSGAWSACAAAVPPPGLPPGGVPRPGMPPAAAPR